MHTLSLAGGLLLAQRAALAADAVVLPEVEVTEKRATEAEQRSPTAFVSEVDTTQRDAAIETTTDVLQEAVGVQVQRFGGLGAFSTISIRGSSASQVPVFLDGIPLSQAQNQTVNLADLPLDSLQRVDIYRGTVPVGFGGGGIGGVVNLVTRPASATPSTELTTGYGSFETRKLTVSHTQEVGGVDVLANLAYLGSKGDFTYNNDNGTPDNPTDDTRTTRINNAFNSVGLLLKGTRDLTGDLALDAVEEFFFKDQGVPGPGSAQCSNASLLELRSLTYLRLRAARLAGGAVDTSGSLYGVYNLQQFDDPDPCFGAVEATHNQTALVGASNTGTWYAPLGQSVGWFSELAYEAFFPYNATNEPLFPNSGPTQTRLRTTLAVQDVIELVADRVQLVPSLRYDHLLDDFSGVNSAGIPTTSPQTSTLDLWTPAAGVQARIAPWLTVRANIGRFQRAPSFAELFGNTGTVVGNPDLKPETGINRDVGFLAGAGAYGWLDRAQLEFAYFHNNVDDLIAFTQVSRAQFRAVNIGAARIEGEEVTLTGSALGHLGLELNYTHQDTENRSGLPDQQGNPLPLRPADELFARTELFNAWGKLYYEYTYISSDTTDLYNLGTVPSRSIHTLGLVATPLPWLAVKFEAANITNADIRDLGDFPLPGLSFFGSIKVTL
jgi:iron complex outermembrane receptor protein